jgi:hypothetical protein
MFYCVNVEFYENGKVLACTTGNEKRGLHQCKGIPGMRAFKIWFDSETTANDFENDCKSGQYDSESVMHFYSGMKDIERTLLTKGSKRSAA